MIYVIGDIHGCLQPLMELMDRVKLTPDDRLIFLGDYVNRGPDSKGVIDYLLTLKGNITFLKGNHEQMFLDYLNGKERLFFLFHGGDGTLRSYGDPLNVPEAHVQFLKGLHLYYETDECLFVHAGIRPTIPLEQQDPEDLLWIRGWINAEFIHPPTRYPKTIVFGHASMEKVLMLPDRIGIDTGCVYGGKLTCLVFPSRELIQVENRS